MLTTNGGFWAELRLNLPLVALTGLGLGLGLGVAVSRILEKKRVRVSRTKESSELKNVHDDYDEEDFISRLPDDVLCSILSQLTIKDAINTSILSNRWRKIYLFLPNLCFNCPCTFKPLNQHCTCRPEYRQGLLAVMDRFVQLPASHKITSFELSFCLGEEFTAYIEQWMHRIAKMGIEELLLRFCCKPFIISKPGSCSVAELITFHLQLLAEASMLRSLSLFACNLEPNFQGPFSSLMSLKLDFVSLVNGEVQSILSSCPKLETLTLTYCGLPSKLFIGGPELPLKFLAILRCFGVEEIALFAGNLTSFEAFSSNRITFPLSHVPKLQQVYLRLECPGDLLYIIGRLAQDMPQLESLYVEFTNSEGFYMAPELPTFSNMRQIYLLMVFGDWVFDLPLVAALTISCPLLQRLNLVAKVTNRSPIRSLRPSPRDHLHLKEVEFGGFRGSENEIALMLFLLKSSVVLEQMLITTDSRYYTGGGRWHKEKGLPFDKKELEKIHQQLEGQAASPIARVIIK